MGRNEKEEKASTIGIGHWSKRGKPDPERKLLTTIAARILKRKKRKV